MTTLQSGALIGGIGLFLLGMWLMTEGLRLAAGAALREVLASSTRTRWRALGSGILLTAVVQSSSAVTVAAIGFVNAGLLSLGQVLWVLFGSNVGTSMTGWLVALLGLKIKIDLLALPLIGVGMLLRLTGGASRRGSIGLALAGFGVLFLGIDVLRNAFTDLAAGMSFPEVDGFWGVAAHVLIGAILTMLMQSSSAATALILTAAQGGLLGLESAAAVVIGSNIGTTGTALIAAIGATANAKRAAAAHVLFNLLTGCVALLALPWLLSLTQWLGGWVGAPAGVATVLALFHTVFNLLGVLLMWPLSDRLAAFLEGRFRSAEEDEGRARYLDAATAVLPALAIDALNREVARYGSIALRAAHSLTPLDTDPTQELARVQRTLAALSTAIDDFVVRLNRAAMTQDTAMRLAKVLRRSAYYANMAEQLPAIAAAAQGLPAGTLALESQLAAGIGRLRTAAAALLLQLDREAKESPAEKLDGQASAWEAEYQRIKAALLEAGALGILTPSAMDLLLRSHSALRRALQQALKASKVAQSIGEPAPR
ncbi:Na/Pi symporter [Hydrogenophaga sp.]|uniref:Na/Pi cotransporter family protein n=1 Tax=Hydrogenophaga sp. TaxID=1904254 RepID=UPI0025BD7C63|nr:Na/Pi symporter [Hydrogenophaga sp.]